MRFTEILDEEFDFGNMGSVSVRYNGNCSWDGSSYNCNRESIAFFLCSPDGKEIDLTWILNEEDNLHWMNGIITDLEEQALEDREARLNSRYEYRPEEFNKVI